MIQIEEIQNKHDNLVVEYDDFSTEDNSFEFLRDNENEHEKISAVIDNENTEPHEIAVALTTLDDATESNDLVDGEFTPHANDELSDLPNADSDIKSDEFVGVDDHSVEEQCE